MRIQILVPEYTDKSGNKHAAGDVVDLPDDEATNLIFRCYAKAVDEDQSASEEAPKQSPSARAPKEQATKTKENS